MEMHPFSYFTKIADGKDAGNNYLLFFGRISKYKGVDILLNAMPDVIDKFPEEQLIIAGKGASDDLLQHPVLQQKKYNACIINRYIPNEELVGLIKQAKLVICPYIDATQSGVLMTAFALNKPVIASNVGAFQEHIKSGVNGFLVPASDSKALAQTIIECLGQDRYLHLEENIKNNNKKQPWKNNLDKLALAYGDKNM
jgi:glycosyltransferase involved in cell wall biosynthesis